MGEMTGGAIVRVGQHTCDAQETVGNTSSTPCTPNSSALEFSPPLQTFCLVRAASWSRAPLSPPLAPSSRASMSFFSRNRSVLGIGCPFLDGDLAALDFAALAESGHVAWAWVVERQLALYGRSSWGTGRPGLGTCVLDMSPPTRTTAAPASPLRPIGHAGQHCHF